MKSAMIREKYRKTTRGIVVILREWLNQIDTRFVVAFTLPFCVYLLTLAPTIYNLDSAELTTAAATGGIVRSTGYPLYLTIGYFWSRIPIGDVGYRMNLLSAVCGAFTIALVARILRQLRIGPWASFGALGLLACSTYFWALSLIAEVYTMHTVLMAGLILALLHWGNDPKPYRLACVGLMLGLGASHHGATILLIPGCVWYILTVAPRQALKPRAFLFAAGLFLLGASFYLYLPLRYSARPAFNYAGHYDASGAFVPVNLHTLEGLWWLVSGRQFANCMFAYSGNALWQEVVQFGIQLWRAFFAIGIGPGLLGIGLLLYHNWRLGGMLLLMFLTNAGFYILYHVADKVTMFLPAYLIWTLWLGIGYQWLLKWVRKVDDIKLKRLHFLVVCTIIIGVVLLSLIWNWRLVDLSNDWSTRERGEAILQVVASDAIVLGWWDIIPAIKYLQLVENQRPDVQAINRFMIDFDDMYHLIIQNIEHYPIYIDKVSPGLYRFVEAESVEFMYKLQTIDSED